MCSYLEQRPSLRKLLHMVEPSFVTFRFVYIYEGISFDFEGVAISVDTETSQIASIRYPVIPFEQLKTLEEANAIVAQLIDVELLLENNFIEQKKRLFVYTIDYPTSTTGEHIQFVDAFTGDIHWIDNR